MRKQRINQRKVSPTEAVKLRQGLVARLNSIAPQWSAMSDSDLSKLLIAHQIATATGLRFDPDRVREFRRSLAKLDAEDPYFSHDPEVAAEAIRVVLLRAISDLGETITDERRAEIKEQVWLIRLVLCQDRLADYALLHKAVEVAERAIARDG